MSDSSFWSHLLVPERTKRFESLVRPLDIDTRSVQAQRAHPIHTAPLTQFLEQFFGQDPMTLKPVLDPSHEIILFLEEENHIVATIRYRYAGRFDKEPIHIIDCFCIHPSKRKTGLATKLLAILHAYTNDRGLKYSLFLKEGRPLPNHQPLYSSAYVFRRIRKVTGALKDPLSPRITGALKDPLSPLKASALVAAYRVLRPEMLWIYDIGNTNQRWFFWKSGLRFVLFCVQDAHQTFRGGSVGWITAFVASEPVPWDPFESLVDGSGYDWIWMDEVWLPEETPVTWTQDGPFHWYAYQWTTNLPRQRFYGLVV